MSHPLLFGDPLSFKIPEITGDVLEGIPKGRTQQMSFAAKIRIVRVTDAVHPDVPVRALDYTARPHLHLGLAKHEFTDTQKLRVQRSAVRIVEPAPVYLLETPGALYAFPDLRESVRDSLNFGGVGPVSAHVPDDEGSLPGDVSSGRSPLASLLILHNLFQCPHC